jgi:SAM-dependent methyltransferase
MSEAERLFSDGQAYERLMGRWSRLVGASFLNWLDLPRGLRWLEVGCGNGAFTEELMARCAPIAVTAIDASEDQLAYARTRLGASPAQFRIGNAQELRFEDHAFDVAAMALVLGFLLDPARALAEMARVVRPGGWVATYMWDMPGGGLPVAPIYATLKELGLEAPLPPRPQDSSQQGMRELWERAGIESIDTRVIRIPVVFTSFEDFWESNTVPVGPLGKFLASLAPGANERLRSRLRQQVDVAPDGHIAYQSFANAIKGRVPMTSRAT